MKSTIIIKYWPLWGAALIAFGTIYLASFYSVFNIDIMQFVEWSEIVQSILSKIAILVFMGLLGTMQVFIAQRNADIELESKTNKHAQAENRFIIRLRFYFIGYNVFFWIMIGSLFLKLTSLKISFFQDGSSWAAPLISYLASMAAVILISELIRKIRNLNASEFYKKYVSLTFILIAAVCVINLLSTNEAKSIINNKPFIVSIELANQEKIQSNDSIIYVGKTKGFIFLYNDRAKKTIIFPVNEIKKITIESRKNSL